MRTIALGNNHLAEVRPEENQVIKADSERALRKVVEVGALAGFRCNHLAEAGPECNQVVQADMEWTLHNAVQIAPALPAVTPAIRLAEKFPSGIIRVSRHHTLVGSKASDLTRV